MTMSDRAKLLSNTLLRVCGAANLSAGDTLQALACAQFSYACALAQDRVMPRKQVLDDIAALISATWTEAEIAQLQGEAKYQKSALAVANALVAKYTLRKE